MAMTNQELNKVLQIGKVDVGNATLFGTAVRKEVDTHHLTLVISTGGSGMSSIRAAMATARQKLNPNYVNYVKFIVVDSDTSEVTRVDNEGIDNINISSAGAQRRLEKTYRSEFYKNFVPVNYDVGLINPDGAAQDRMTGKIKLYDNNAQGTTNDSLIRNKVRKLFQEDWMAHKNLPLDVMILTGISGGNGSGTFMDIATIVRGACSGNLKGQLSIYGYVLLPDTADGFARDDRARNSMRGNGFAALKELENYWGLTAEPDRREIFPAPEPAETQIVSNTSKIFDHVFLISGDYNKAVSMVAETIVNTIADSGGTFNQTSFISNESTAMGNKLSNHSMLDTGILKKSAYPEDSFHYLGLGYAQAAIPETVVIPNVVSHVCSSLYIPDTSIQNIASQQDVFIKGTERLDRIHFERAMRMLLNLPGNAVLNENSLWAKVFRELEPLSVVPDNNVELTVREVQANQTQQFFAGFQIPKVTNHAVEEYVTKSIPRLIENLFERTKAVMKMFGPRAIECLFDGIGNPDERGVPENFKSVCLRHQMEVVGQKFAQMSNAPGRFPVGLQPQSFDPLKKKALAFFKGEANDAAIKMVRCSVAQRMAGMQGAWQTEFVIKAEMLRGKCEQFARVLETMADYYTGVGSSLDAEDFEQFARTSGGANDINLCQDERIYRWVRGCVQNKIATVASGHADEVRAALVDDFYENENAWLSEEKGKARKAFDDCLARICKLGAYSGAQGGLHLSISDYFAEVLDGLPEQQQAEEINRKMREIVERLTVGSTASLQTKGINDAANVSRIILVPEGLLNTSQGGYISSTLNSIVGEGKYHGSAVVDSIICYQTSAGNGMSDLANMDLWEDAYEASFDPSIHLNNGERFKLHVDTGHSQYKELTKTETDEIRNIRSPWPISEEDNMIFGTGLSWEHYPSPNYARYGSEFEGTRQTREAKYRRDVFNKKVQKAIELHIIEEEGRDSENWKHRKWFINTIPRDWSNLDIRKYSDKEASHYLRGIPLFEHLKEQNRMGTPLYRKQIMLTDSQAFGAGGYDFSNIVTAERWTKERVNQESELYMKRTLRKATELYQELEDTLYRFYDLEQALKVKDDDLQGAFRANVFAELFIKGVINYDDPVEQFEWTVAVAERRGKLESENVIAFGRGARAKLPSFDKRLFQDDMRLAVVYRKVCEMADEKTLDLVSLQKFAEEHYEGISSKEQDSLLDERLDVLEKSLASYEKVAGKNKDVVGTIMDTYELDDDALDMVTKLVDFYEAVRKAIKEFS